MVRAWYMAVDGADQRSPHMTDPPQMLTLEELKAKTGAEYFKIDADNYLKDATLNKLKADRNYSYEDEVDMSEKNPDYEKTIKMWFEEHLHPDQEIRLILDGKGYFDARDKDNKWVRIETEKGDMLVLPAGLYHRFTTDCNNYVKAKRYFSGVPVWTPINRPADDHPARKQYLQTMGIAQ